MNFIQEQENMFDKLPDAIIFTIFNKLQDAKSLCISMSVCKRFYSIIPQVDFISLSIPHHKPHHHNKSSRKSSSFKNLITKILIKPLNFLLQMIIKPRTSSSDDDSFCYSLAEILKPFKGIQKLDIKLPSHGNIEIGSRNKSNSKKTLLKWRGEFGKQLQSCVILGATSLSRMEKLSTPFNRIENSHQDDEENDQLPFTDDDLKRRIVWTMTCLIAASARHYLLSEMLAEHEMVKHVDISDESNQGKLCMNQEQIKELRGSFNSMINKAGSSSSSSAAAAAAAATSLMEMRSIVPALKMKMWYASEMEIPGSNWMLKGATLMVVRPADEAAELKSDGELVMGAFDGDDEEHVQVFNEAVCKLMKCRRNYTLEINSF